MPSRRKPPWWVVALAVAVVAGGAATAVTLSSRDSHPKPAAPGSATAAGATSTSAADETTSPPTPTSAASGPHKPVLRGLIDRNGQPPAGYPISGFVVQAYWSDLQPQQGGPLAAGNAIDVALGQVRALNASGARLGLKLRVYAGVHAPDWAKQLGGAPVAMTDPASGEAGTVPRFWTAEFAQAYAGLQAALAARYDAVPEVREVVISQCTTIFAEPFLRQASDPASRQGLLDAGFTTTADEACQRSSVDAHRVWKQTSSDLAVNPYQSVDQPTPTRGARRAGGDVSFPESVMRYCRAQLGARCGLENNSLRVAPGPAYPELYQAMKALGPNLTFQTAQARRAGDLSQVVAMAADLGGVSVELPVSYKQEPAATLRAALGPALARLEANPTA